MRKRHSQLVITFPATTEAMRMEKLCGTEGLPGRLIPLPSQLSAGCGLAWKTELDQKEKLLAFMEERQLKWEMICQLELM